MGDCMSVCVCVCARDRVSVCVMSKQSNSQLHGAAVYACVTAAWGSYVCVCVCERERVCVCACVCVCVMSIQSIVQQYCVTKKPGAKKKNET
jgi:hypothetical protein